MGFRYLVCILLLAMSLAGCQTKGEIELARLNGWIEVERNIVCIWSERMHRCLCVYSLYDQAAITFAPNNVCNNNIEE